MSTAPSRTTNTSGPSLTCQMYGSSVQCSRTVASSIRAMSSAAQGRAPVNDFGLMTRTVMDLQAG